MSDRDTAGAAFFTLDVRFYCRPEEREAITAMLGFEPTKFLPPRTKGSRPASGTWIHDGSDTAGYQDEWTSVADSFDFMFGVLADRATAIRQVSERYEGYWWLGNFFSICERSFVLERRHLLRLPEYGLGLYCGSFVFSDDPETGDATS
ncbi:hypothetical protein [Oharaeibacter diazotrophicus]|uniref:DUF4279 domain-containing protein n=1 Tax=Oharaeibacter diazotrophicus TaxID=1920512 RepID=A0A4R6RG18_9HYPH|nr:hypothetical protein [Oharaeibacter diazotrophicus]TDP85192.1 hypothetical protein EDD54_2040 [Oharaeibacter diazotrophicus]BBE74162.1 hypothetical protein OHA_1_03790 [Pleomorphomonas sp. SM30]GLS76150.1 hypothetical protein GCM10007904_14850 [Oharaeibacter diazotrophicus]